MAMANKRESMFFNMLLVLSVLLMVTIAAESMVLRIGIGKPKPLSCAKVYAAQSGDSCFSVTQKFNLTNEIFSGINPNLVCEKIFAGEWLCIDGSTK